MEGQQQINEVHNHQDSTVPTQYIMDLDGIAFFVSYQASEETQD